jgi:hypothetical protein
MLVDISAVDPSPLCPDLDHGTWRRRGRTAQTLPSLCPSALYTLPTSVTSLVPTHSTPSLRPSPASMPPRPPCPASLMHVARPPCAGHLLGTLAPALLAYIKPRRAHEWTHTTPSELPDIFLSLVLSRFDIASSAGELLDAGGATAFSLCWTNSHREVEEEGRRSLFRPALSSSASSLSSLAIEHSSLQMPVSSSPSRWARRRRTVGLESNGSVPIRVT